jgi:molybdenum cofactor cytidylyltransferase
MDKVGAIILAAGLSSRMGESNKLLLPIDGVPMIRHVVETYLSSVDGEVCVVTGYEAERVEAAISDLPTRLVRNVSFEQGQPFSVRSGLLEAPETECFLIGLGDQPELTSQDLHSLVEAHLAADPTRISIPFYNEIRGNPIVVPASMRTQLLEDKANPGCGKFTRENPDSVQNILMSQAGFFNDIDTPAAYAVFQQTSSKGA